MQDDALSASLPVAFERTALALRYIVYFIMAPVFLMGFMPGDLVDFWVLTGIVLTHNAVVHVVLWTRSYAFFFTRINFLIYFLQIVVAVAITGPETTDAYILYHLFILGFSVYDRRFWRVMAVALACAVSFLAVLLFEKLIEEINISFGALLLRLMSILTVGWLVAVLSERLRRAEVLMARQTANLAASEATLRAILNSAGDPILVFDENEFITDANDQAARFLGVPKDQLIGQRVRGFLFDDGTLPYKFAELRARGQSHGEEVFITSSGDERTVEVLTRCFNRGQSRYFVALLRDITEQKDLQEATRQANIRLERLNTELRQLDSHKASFMSSIAINLRSPLSVLSGYIGMLLDDELGEVNPDQRRALQSCRRSLARVFRIVDHALDLHSLSAPHRTHAETDDGGPPNPS
jgi:PAS domain S-box-containing protein